MTYTYTNVPFTGYHFNGIMKITSKTGVECTGFSLSNGDNGLFNVNVQMASELTTSQKNILDTLMINDCTLIPINTGTTVYIKDLWEYRDWLKQQTGETFDIYFSKKDSLTDPNAQSDTIELHFKNTLTQNKKNTLKTLYTSMLSES